VFRDLAARAGDAQSLDEALALSIEAMAGHALDLLYALDPAGQSAHLSAATGLAAATAGCPVTLSVGSPGHSVWPVWEVVRSRASVRVGDVGPRLGPPPYGPYPEPPAEAMALPITPPRAERPSHVVIAGVSPRLRLDETYLDFLHLLAAGVASSIANARAYGEELAEPRGVLDRAKTACFSNGSHGFRDVGGRIVATIPMGDENPDPARDGIQPGLAPKVTGADAFAQEALPWLPGGGDNAAGGYGRGAADPALLGSRVIAKGHAPADCLRILLADDNAGMREYLARLMASRFDVEAAPDGRAALDAARANPPDVVLSGVMTPRPGGVDLLRELRADARLREIPVILQSARAGEEDRVEGMAEGADDYLTKPFSARELIARVESLASLSRLRREAAEADRRGADRLRRMINVDGVGVLRFDAGTATLLDAHDFFLRMLGYSRAEVAAGAVTWRALTPPECPAESERQIAGLAGTGRNGPCEEEYSRLDGTRSWVLVAGPPSGTRRTSSTASTSATGSGPRSLREIRRAGSDGP